MSLSSKRSQSTSDRILPSREQFDTPLYFHLSNNRPYYLPLPINVTSIDPALVLTEAIKYRNWAISPEIRRHFHEHDHTHTRTLIGNTESDEHAFAGIIYWAGAFTGFGIVPGVPYNYFWKEWLPDLIEWMNTSVKALESFINCYPGERIRRVPWEEGSFEQGIGFAFHTLRLRARTFQTTINRIAAPNTAWKFYHDRMMKPPGIEQQTLYSPYEDSDEGTDEVGDGTDHSTEDETDRSTEHQTEGRTEDGTEAETDDWITIDSRSMHPSELESNRYHDSDDPNDGDRTVRGGTIRDGLNNGWGIPQWNIRDTPASEGTLSTLPAPRNRRLNYICSETSEEEYRMEAAFNQNITNDGTDIFVGNPARPLIPLRLSSSDTNDEGDIMKEAIHEVQTDGTVVYIAITVGRPAPEATCSSSDGGLEEQDAMEGVATDNVSETGTVIYDSIVVRHPTRQVMPSPPPSAVRARDGLRSVPRSNYRALNQGSR